MSISCQIAVERIWSVLGLRSKRRAGVRVWPSIVEDGRSNGAAHNDSEPAPHNASQPEPRTLNRTSTQHVRCDSSFTCEDYNTDRAHPGSPFHLRRAHPGPGPHIPPPRPARHSCRARRDQLEFFSNTFARKISQSKARIWSDCLICAGSLDSGAGVYLYSRPFR